MVTFLGFKVVVEWRWGRHILVRRAAEGTVIRPQSVLRRGHSASPPTASFIKYRSLLPHVAGVWQRLEYVVAVSLLWFNGTAQICKWVKLKAVNDSESTLTFMKYQSKVHESIFMAGTRVSIA